jgi:hypothetical protein
MTAALMSILPRSHLAPPLRARPDEEHPLRRTAAPLEEPDTTQWDIYRRLSTQMRLFSKVGMLRSGFDMVTGQDIYANLHLSSRIHYRFRILYITIIMRRLTSIEVACPEIPLRMPVGACTFTRTIGRIHGSAGPGAT